MGKEDDHLCLQQPCGICLTERLYEQSLKLLNGDCVLNWDCTIQVFGSLWKVQKDRDVIYEQLLSGHSPPLKRKEYCMADKHICQG
ncbi:hypothetical protein E2320_014245, partial [Naja naja]